MNNKGFTITEVLVALLLFSITAIPLTVNLHHLLSDRWVKNKTDAIRIAKNELEEVLAFRKLVNGESSKEIDKFIVKKNIKGESLKEVRVSVYRHDKLLYDLFTYVYME
ncbi:MAG: prepilin-type N-terminal cleavage/methylation domain-containing protein [Fibrobacteres bacterium]|nr:prepilin-type N-terminal cleavage/methylation domain-containing protein [Fibrobacterota bacterium]